MILKKYDKPTDVIIVGCNLYNEKENEWSGDVLITDDYHDFTVINHSNYILKNMECDGFINVLSKEEFYNNKEHIANELQNSDEDFLVLPNFTGEIGVKVVFKLDGEENLHIEDLNLDEYLMHQKGFTENFDKPNFVGVKYCITIPNNTDIRTGKYIEDDDKFLYEIWTEL